MLAVILVAQLVSSRPPLSPADAAAVLRQAQSPINLTPQTLTVDVPRRQASPVVPSTAAPAVAPTTTVIYVERESRCWPAYGVVSTAPWTMVAPRGRNTRGPR